MAPAPLRATAVALAVVLAGCASAPSRLAEPSATLVWPPPPEPARLAFVQALERPEDLEISKSVWRRVFEFVFGETDERLIRPMAVVASAELLYVADPGAHGVHRFNLAKREYDILRRDDDEGLPSPVGLAAGSAGEVFVADSALAELFVADAGARIVRPFPLGEKPLQPTGLAFDPKAQELFVADTAAHEIKIYGRDGQLRRRLGKRGDGDGQFNFPTLLWREPGGRLFVTDSLNFRIQMFDADGSYLGRFGRPGNATGTLARPKGVATDRHGHVYVIDSLFHAMQIFDTGGRLLLNVGQQGQKTGDFWLPAGIFAGPQDTIYVADSYNRRVQVFRYVGGEP